jgi:hypothetical protein
MRRGYALLAVVLVAGAGALVWWAPWRSSPDAVVQALAAFGNRRVVHVVSEPAVDLGGIQVAPMAPETEAWYDRRDRRVHEIVRQSNRVVTDRVFVLKPPLPHTPFHPVESFVVGYVPELEQHRLRVAGSKRVQARSVLLLRSADLVVAVDPVSYQALWVNDPGMSDVARLAVAETIPFDPADFVLLRKRKPRHL